MPELFKRFDLSVTLSDSDTTENKFEEMADKVTDADKKTPGGFAS